MGKIIEVSNVFKSYGKKKVLEKFSFSLDEGKSTTLRLLAVQEKPEAGSVQILGEDPYSFDFSHRPDTFFIHDT